MYAVRARWGGRQGLVLRLGQGLGQGLELELGRCGFLPAERRCWARQG